MIDLSNPLLVAQALIKCPSVTPRDEGAQALMTDWLSCLGFEVRALPFGEVMNLFARRGSGPCLCYAGHTDVVPIGNEAAWQNPPFAAVVEEGVLYGRGAADMKGSIAAFVAATARYLRQTTDPVALAFLITGDEEGPALHGTRPMLESLSQETPFPFDHCLVGEPSSHARIGDTIKPGRRGSVNVVVTVEGQQGHVAYPHLARNPVHALNAFLAALISHRLDDGFENFEPSALQVTDLHVGNHAHNVIPQIAQARLNIRFNPHHTGRALVDWMNALAEERAKEHGVSITLTPHVTGEAFLTGQGPFTGLLSDAVASVTGERPAFTTGGGTSDARFIQAYVPVAELGLVNATIHKVNEAVPVGDLETLTRIYLAVIRGYSQMVRP